MVWLKTFRLRQRRKKVLRFKKYSHENCLNCHHPLGKFDRFCSRCGQKNTRRKLNLSDLIREFLSSLFAYDSRIQRTFNAIFTSPGKIAQEYIAGKRVKYVNPFRFFIFIAVVFFLLISWLIPYEDMYKKDSSEPEIEKEQKKDQNAVISDSILLDTLQNKDRPLKEKDTIQEKLNEDDIYVYFKKNDLNTFEEAIDETELEDNFSSWLLYKFLFGASMVEDRPTDFVRFLLPKLPFFIFFFLPIFTLFSKVFYIRRRFTYTEHLVFNFYQQSVFFMLFFFDSMIYKFIDLDLSLFFLIIFSVYHVAAKKRFYKQNYFKTIAKFLGLSFLYLLFFLMIIGTFTLLSVGFYR